MASEYTTNYNLDLYASEDKPNLRDQYNAAMGKIDAQMKVNADGIVNANASAITAVEAANTAKESATTAAAAAENAQTAATTAGSTAANALSVAQETATSLDAFKTSVPNTYAPTNHASTSTKFGKGTNQSYGHLRVYDTWSTSANADNGCAISPLGAHNMYQAIIDMGVPVKIAAHTNFAKTGSGYNISGHLDITGNHLTNTVIVNVQFTSVTVSSMSSFASVKLFSIPSEWRPAYAHNTFIGFSADGEYFTLVIQPSGDVVIGLSAGTYSYSTCGESYTYTVGE